MKSSFTQKLLLAATLLMAGATTMAEDIDIYQANNSSATSNLLMVIDNSGSWSSPGNTTACPAGVLVTNPGLAGTVGGVEACGIWKAVDAVGSTPALLGKINMGLTMFSWAPGVIAGAGFKFPATVAPSALVNMNAAGITSMKAVLSGLERSGGGSSTGNGTDVGGAMQEAWAFYTGRTGMSGTTYPGISVDTCGKNFVIFVGISKVNSQPGDSNAGNVLSALDAAGASTEQKTYLNWTTNNGYSKSNNYWADEWTRFSKQNNAITTYTITLKDTSSPNPDYERFMKSMADASGGKAFVVDVDNMDAFVQALLQIFNEIQAVNSVFAAASLPISTNATGSFLNQIYYGMFRPDGAGLPRWAGNLKQYRFALDNTNPLIPSLYLADARANDPGTGRPFPAINSAGTGFFSPNAVSFWTSKDISTLPDSIDPTGALAINGGQSGGFFIFNPQSAGGGFDLPDGEIVEKGGVAQRIRLENLVNTYSNAPGTSGNLRRLYTCTTGAVNCSAGSPGSLLSATPFATTNADLLAHSGLGAGAPTTPITSLTRNDGTASVVMNPAMSPVLANGQLANIAGAASGYNGNFSVGGPPTGTTFTYTANVLPPAAGTGTFTAAIPGITQGISSIALSGTTTNTVTATVTTPVAHGYAINQKIAIAGAGAGFDNGAVTITAVPTATTFQYTASILPLAGAGGTAAIGTNTQPIVSMTRIGTRDLTAPFGQTVVVVTGNNHTFTAGALITISGSDVASYNGIWSIQSVGNSCQSGSPNKKFCIKVPTSPAVATAPATASTAVSVDVTLVRGSSCVAPSPNSPAAIVTATSAGHSFTAGQSISINGGVAKDTLYTGTHTILASPAPTATQFSYSITTTPVCTDLSVGKTAAAGGAPAPTLINWVRGEDSVGDEASPGVPINVRPSVHGDVLHSRPAVVNYGGTTGVVLFYGANNGVFHAVNGNQTAAIGSVPAGGELWGFVAEEFFPKLMRQYLNAPVVKLEATAGSILPAPQPKDYFFDGSIGVYQNGSTVHLYITARRGGRVIYALDVSNPAAPRFMWKKTNTSDSGAFAELGQTWSTPKVVKVKGHANPVIIFGAGYDPAEDTEPQPAANAVARTMGRGIFVLDALDGSIVWKATTGGGAGVTKCNANPCLLDMPYPIPSDVTVMDRDRLDAGDFVDRVYVGDLGGNIWRVDLEPLAGSAPANWQVTKFASVGGSGGSTKRKLFFPPDVVSTPTFERVMFATGDREHPTRTQQSVNILNRFYMLKDVNVGNDACPLDPSTLLPTCVAIIADNTSSTACVGALPKTSASCTEAVPTNLFNASSVLPTSASSVPATVGLAYDNSGFGFYMNLLNAVAHRQTDNSILYGPDIAAGEKVVNAPTTIGGNTFWGTNTPIPPDPGVCQPNLGTARGYAVNFITGVFNFAVFDGGGLPPSPVAGLVEVDNVVVPFIIGGVPPPTGFGPGSSIGGIPAPSSLGGGFVEIDVGALRTRSYWYRDIGNR